MKKILTFFTIAAVLISGCKKNPPADNGGENIKMSYNISMKELPANGIKTTWKEGDCIYVFFDDDETRLATEASKLPYLLLEWDGSRWNTNDSFAPSKLPESGKLTAIHCIYSNDAPAVKDGKFYVGSSASWYLYDSEVAYVNSENKVSFSLDMKGLEGAVDVRIPIEGIDGSSYALSVSNDDLSAGIKPISVTFNPATGEISVVEGNIGDEIFPEISDGAYVFCGKAVLPEDGRLIFVLNEKDDVGNNLEASYTYVKSDVTNLEYSLMLPNVSEWISPTKKITTVLYEDGLLVINEMPENHVSNSIEHGAVVLTHGFIFNLIPKTTEQNPETGEIKETIHLPWYSEKENDPNNEWQQKIKRIEFGSVLSPSNMQKAFINLGELISIDTKNLVITSNRGEGQQPFWRMSEAFKNCKVLRDLDVSGWDVSEVTSMDYAFDQCYKLQNLDVSNWNVSKVADMRGLFRQCQNVPVLDISKWKTSNVKRMKELFRGVFKVTELDMSGFDTAKVTDMAMMFYQCFALTTIYASEKFVTTAVNESDERLFYQCEKLVGGNGTVWSANNIGREYARIDAEGTPGYFTEKK